MSVFEKPTQHMTEWKLSDINSVIKRVEDTTIDSDTTLMEFIETLDADQRFGRKLLLELERVISTLRSSGMNREVAVAAERFKPNVVGEEIKMFLTDNYGEPGRWDTLVALESFASTARVGLIVMLVMAILKIVGWMISNGKPLSGAGYADAGEYEKSVAEKVDAFNEDPSDDKKLLLIDKYKIAAIKDAVIEISKGELSTEQRDNLVMCATFLDKSISATSKGKTYFSSLAAHLGTSPLLTFLKGMLDDRKVSASNLPEALVDYLLRLRVTTSVYKVEAAKRAHAALPDNARKRGLLIPNELLFGRTSGSIEIIQMMFDSLQDSFKMLARPNAVAEIREILETRSESSIANFRNVQTGIMKFGTAMTSFLGEIGSIIHIINGTQDWSVDISPLIAVKDDIENYFGSFEADSIGDYTIYGLNGAAFLNEAAIAQARSNKWFTGDDYQAILNAICELDDDAIGDPRRASGLARAKDLESALTNFQKEIKNWSDKIKGENNTVMDLYNKLIMKAVHDTKHRPDARDLIQYQYEFFPSEKQDFIQGLQRATDLARKICTSAMTMQTVVNNSGQNPFSKDKK